MLALAATAFRREAAAGKRVLGNTPEISVQDFAQYPAVTTPAADLFVRNHFPIPGAGKLREIRVSGLVERTGDWPIGAARNGARVSAVLECAGNGVGVGAVGCIEWAGEALRAVIEHFGPASQARFVRFTGADRGSEPDSGAVEMAYTRVLPLEAAMRGPALLATAINGQPLAVEHGGPCRVVFPGRYGMDSVKWLTAIELLAEMPEDFYMARRFRRVRPDGPAEPVGEMLPKSVIVTPLTGALVRGGAVRAGGYAWGNLGGAGRVVVQLDARPWIEAQLSPPASAAWRLWQAEFRAVRPGMHVIAARAFTGDGKEQPLVRDDQRVDEYELNQVHRVRFALRP